MKFKLFACLFLVGCTTTPQNLSTTFYSKTSVGLLEISSFDVYKENEILHALVSGLKTEKDKAQTVRYLQSTDNGKHWSLPIEIKNTFPLAGRGNDVQLAAKGQNLVAIWQTQGEIPNSGALVSVYSHDSGKTWHSGKNPAIDNSGDQSHVDLIADKNGSFHTVWLADPEENGYQSLRYARSMDNGENWKPPIKLDDSSCSCCWNTLAISSNDELHVLYRDMEPRDMTLLSSVDNGSNWQSKKIVGDFKWHFDGCPHVGGGIAFDKNNDFYASVWTGEPSKSGLYTVTSVNNVPVKIGKNATHSDIAVLENRVVVVWDEMSAEGTGIFAAQSIDKGATWSTPYRLSTIGTNSTHPRIVANENNALVFWTEKQNKQASQWAMIWLD
jgi:hypothetical protein